MADDPMMMQMMQRVAAAIQGHTGQPASPDQVQAVMSHLQQQQQQASQQYTGAANALMGQGAISDAERRAAAPPAPGLGQGAMSDAFRRLGGAMGAGAPGDAARNSYRRIGQRPGASQGAISDADRYGAMTPGSVPDRFVY